MRNSIKIIVFFILIYLMFWSFYSIVGHYKGYCFYGTHGIRVNEAITITAKENNIDYCSMLRKSFDDDIIFSDFISLKFYDGSAIDHASVVSNLYNYYGSNEFWKRAQSLKIEDKRLVETYLQFEKY